MDTLAREGKGHPLVLGFLAENHRFMFSSPSTTTGRIEGTTNGHECMNLGHNPDFWFPSFVAGISRVP
jgi:hypothetical protein